MLALELRGLYGELGTGLTGGEFAGTEPSNPFVRSTNSPKASSDVIQTREADKLSNGKQRDRTRLLVASALVK